jgi:hypothetical protein
LAADEHEDLRSICVQAAPKKKGLGSIPTERPVKWHGIVPNVGYKNTLADITESFFYYLNQTCADALMANTRIDDQLAQIGPES